jgi:light-regulated signal transduction histidine kinase (bacteriophytochrome)
MQAQSKTLTGLSAEPRGDGSGQSMNDECCVYFTSDSMHDFAGPVNQVCAMADLFLKKYGEQLDAEAGVLIAFVQNSANRLQNLMAGLRRYRQVLCSEQPLCRCDANTLLAGALVSIQQAIDLNGAAITHDTLPELYCDPSQISYAFASLIENSIKFRREQSPEIHVSVSSEESFWVFRVRDNGIGIDPKYRDRIFGVFKRIYNEAYPGAGVGLAIVKRVVERHGGRVWVESDLGQGAIFFLALPKAEARSKKPPRKKRAVRTRAAG